MTPLVHLRARVSARAIIAFAAAALVAVQCGTAPAPVSPGAAAFDTVYRVLQHPRCANCHPIGNRPHVGDHGETHPQNVQRGTEGTGRFAMRCSTCHQPQNTDGPHLPPGAPHWQLPKPDMPLVFEGRSRADLARQLADPLQNGNRTPEQLIEHVTQDPLVLWGWDPGPGRAPVDVPHADFVAAFRTWVDGGCAVPP